MELQFIPGLSLDTQKSLLFPNIISSPIANTTSSTAIVPMGAGFFLVDHREHAAGCTYQKSSNTSFSSAIRRNT